jgi:hypothetical protein
MIILLFSHVSVSGKEYGKLKSVFEDVAQQMKGKATLGLVDCR